MLNCVEWLQRSNAYQKHVSIQTSSVVGCKLHVKSWSGVARERLLCDPVGVRGRV